MSTEREPNPGENEVERDFSIPEDADFTTPGEPMDDDSRAAEERDSQAEVPDATPGNPLGHDE